jgi:hypothetical protein
LTTLETIPIWRGLPPVDPDARPLPSWIGTRLADEFDLEGTAGQVPEFADLLVRDTRPRRR